MKELLGEKRCLTNRQLDHIIENRPKNKEWMTQNQRRVLWRSEEEFKVLGQEQAEIEPRQSLSDRRFGQREIAEPREAIITLRDFIWTLLHLTFVEDRRHRKERNKKKQKEKEGIEGFQIVAH